MTCYIIGCVLREPGRDYVDFVEAIERLANSAWPCFDSTWIISADKSAAQIRDELKPYLSSSDELLVAELSGSAAWRGTSTSFSNGLRGVLAQSQG